MDITAGKLFGSIGQPQPSILGAAVHLSDALLDAWKYPPRRPARRKHARS